LALGKLVIQKMIHKEAHLFRTMAATVSAKAKSRAVNSQDSSPDVQEYSTARRRNSFPASNGNQHTGSPQNQKSSPQVQRTTRGNGVHSPRDSTEKLKQTEWRR